MFIAHPNATASHSFVPPLRRHLSAAEAPPVMPLTQRLALFALLLMAGCSSAPPLQLLSDSSVILPKDSGWSAARQCSRKNPDINGVWVPSPNEIAQLEVELSRLIGRKSKQCCFEGMTLSADVLRASFRQYSGILVDSTRYIYISALPSARIEPQHKYIYLAEAYEICDGGPAYWGVLYNPERRRFKELSFNGSL